MSTITTITPSSAARAVRERVLKANDRFFRAEDFGGSHTAVLRELSRLAGDGELRHVSRGLYWRGVKTMLGMSAPSTLQLVQALVGSDGVGPAHASAALALGLSSQHPRADIIAVPKRTRSVDGRILLKDRSGRRGRTANKLNWREVALLEVLADWSEVVEVPQAEAVATLVDLLGSAKVRPAKLAAAAKDEPAIVREGLRGLMLKRGLDTEARRIAPALSENVKAQALIAA